MQTVVAFNHSSIMGSKIVIVSSVFYVNCTFQLVFFGFRSYPFRFNREKLCMGGAWYIFYSDDTYYTFLCHFLQKSEKRDFIG